MKTAQFRTRRTSGRCAVLFDRIVINVPRLPDTGTESAAINKRKGSNEWKRINRARV